MDTPLTNSMIENPSHWRLSLLIGTDGLNVLIRREVGESDAITATIPFGAVADSAASSVEEAIYANPLLLQPFGKIDIVFNGGFTLVEPSGTDLDAIDKLFPSTDEEITRSTPIDSHNELIYRINRGVFNFIQRTFDGAKITHSLTVLGEFFSHQSRLGNSSKMFVDIDKNSLNALIFNQLGLAMASSFKFNDISTAAYFVLASADTAGLDFSNDEIRIVGNAEQRGLLMPVLRKYARKVMPGIIPAGAFNGDVASLQAPYSLLILPLCE